MSEEVSIYGENAITGSIDDAALAEKAEANGVTLTDNGETTNTETPKETAGATPDETKTPSDDASIEQKVADLKSAEDALKDDLKTKGVGFETAVSEYNEKGVLSDATMDALEKAGYPKAVVEGFIKSRQILENQYTSAVYEAAGGEEAYSRMIQWAAANLPKVDIEAFNAAIDSGNLGTVQLIMGGIRSAMGEAMTQKHGTSNPSVMGGPATTSTTGGFADKAEMVKAMSDKRYCRDPQYTKLVESRMAKTTWL
jgi:hypothetical protein